MANPSTGDFSNTVAPDGGWGWVVCGATFVCLGLTEGLSFTFGLIFVELLEYYRESPGKTAAVGSTLSGTTMLAAPLVAVMVKRFGCRRVTIAGGLICGTSVALSSLSPNVTILILTFSFVGGVGKGMVFLPAMLSVGFYFHKKKSLAYGIASSGTGVGIAVLSNIYNVLEEEYTWRGTLVIIGGVLLNCIVCGSLYRPLMKEQPQKLQIATIEPRGRSATLAITSRQRVNGPAGEISPIEQTLPPPSGDFSHSSRCVIPTMMQESDTSTAAEGTDLTNCARLAVIGRKIARQFGLTMLLDCWFILVTFIMLLWVSFSTLLTILPHYALLVGLSDAQSALLVTTMGITNVAGRLVLGYVADMFNAAIWVYMGVLFVGSISALLIPFTTSFGVLSAEVAAFGASFGTCLSLRQVVLLDTFGVRKLTDALGLVSMFQGMAYIVGPPIAGRLYEYTGSYRTPFYLISAAYALAGLLCIPVGTKIRRKHNQKINPQTNIIESTYL